VAVLQAPLSVETHQTAHARALLILSAYRLAQHACRSLGVQRPTQLAVYRPEVPQQRCSSRGTAPIPAARTRRTMTLSTCAPTLPTHSCSVRRRGAGGVRGRMRFGAPCRDPRWCGRSLRRRRLDRVIATRRATRTTHPRRRMSRRTFLPDGANRPAGSLRAVCASRDTLAHYSVSFHRLTPLRRCTLADGCDPA
jgi:hypothetical protein